MAAVAPPAEQATDLLQKMTLEPKNKPLDAPEVAKKSSGTQNGTVNGGEVKKAPGQSLDRSATPFLQNMDPNTWSYYYGGAHAWGEDCARYMNPDGVEKPHGVYGDVYNSGYGYPPYGPYPSPGSPIPTMGHDGQLYSPQPYQYQTSFYQLPGPTNAPYGSSKVPTSKSEVSTSASPGQPPIPLDSSKGLYMGPLAPGMINRMYPNNQMYSSFNTGLGFRPNFYDSRTNGRWGPVMDSKYKPRGRGHSFYGYGNENLDGLGELNRGPRANNLIKNQKGYVPTVPVPVKGQDLLTNGNADESAVPAKDQFNQADFSDSYADAKFFIIKSYSEDDIHKSVKYNVWASTPNGNKKLDASYQEAQEKAGGCPIFLFFSVNTSGQFVGVAEMVSPVNFNKTVDYWQQDKWTGCFSVKWHIVKDVPNNLLKHILLENNENKPVTNSRDTQEVKLEQGLQMLKLFKEHISKTSILDDFAFYENRQKVMQEKRAKQKQQLHKQIADVKPTHPMEEKDKHAASGQPEVEKPFDVVAVLKKEVASKVPGVEKQSEENVAASILTGDAPKGAKPSIDVVAVLKKEVASKVPGVEKQSEENVVASILTGDAPKGAKLSIDLEAVANGIANGC